jgi:folate-dependent phosphoribosylglycinamide formyltransferase PurN
MRDWVVFSSSSGLTFHSTWRALSKEAQSQFKGLFIDRKCTALENCKSFLPSHLIHDYSECSSSSEFEKNFLNWAQSQNYHAQNSPLIFLIGYFKIITPQFFEAKFPLINTHPSLLPAFPGMDKKVHRLAFENTLVSGFSVHMVSEELDAGPIIFQKEVSIADAQSAEEVRDKVRQVEQQHLPLVLEKLLHTNISGEDRKISTRELQSKLKSPNNQEGFSTCVV